MVDGQERLSSSRFANDNLSVCQFGKVKDMKRLTALHEDIVRDVDDIVDDSKAYGL